MPVLIVAAIAIVVGLPVLIGKLLPRRRHVTRRIRLREPREAVWERVSDLARQPEWRDDLHTVERVDDRDGHEVWVEQGGETVRLETLEAIPPSRLVRRILPEGQAYGGTWTIELFPSGIDTLVVISEDGEVPQPLYRFVNRLVLGQTRTIDGYLRALAASFDEEEAVPGD